MIDYIREFNLDDTTNELYSFYSSIMLSITTTMRVINHCQVCNANSECKSYKCINFDICCGAFHPLYSSVLLCNTCYENKKVRETLKVMICLVENMYIDWNVNKTNDIVIRRSNGDIEKDWNLEKTTPLKIYEKNNKYDIKFFCTNEKKSLTKWVLYSELLELNNNLVLSIKSPNIKYIDNDVLKKIFKKNYEQFNKLIINIYLKSKSSKFSKIMNYISYSLLT